MAAGCMTFLILLKRDSAEKNLEKAPPFLLIFLIICVMFLPHSHAIIATISMVLLTCILIGA